MNEITNDYKYDTLEIKNELFTSDEVFKIVDTCFHTLASSSRKEAKEIAINIMNRYKGIVK